MPLAEQDELISIGRASAILGVHADTVRRWERAGALTAVRTPGNQRRFRLSDVEALLTRGAA